jgi:hypothetical protein
MLRGGIHFDEEEPGEQGKRALTLGSEASP